MVFASLMQRRAFRWQTNALEKSKHERSTEVNEDSQIRGAVRAGSVASETQLKKGEGGG